MTPAPAGLETVRVGLDPPVATITLDRPQALNAITPQMLAELATALEWAGQEAVVVVLTGAGRAFSAGVDLKALGGRALDGGTVGDLLDLPRPAGHRPDRRHRRGRHREGQRPLLYRRPRARARL